MSYFENAWQWYQAVAENGRLLDELGNWWPKLDWDVQPLPAGDLRLFQGPEFGELAVRVREPLKDLATLYLFSVFEAAVRDHVRAQVDPEIEAFEHPALVRAGEELQDALNQGSFSRVLTFVKGMDADLVEQVNQIRQYRNWLAHGKKAGSEPKNQIGDPRQVYERLRRFLELLSKSAPRLEDDAGSM